MNNCCPAVPEWVTEEFTDASHQCRDVCLTAVDRVCTMSTYTFDGMALISVHLPGAKDLNAAEFRRGAAEVYSLIRSAFADTATPYPVRMWNFIPGIHDRVDGDLDRYQVFNQARHAAFLDWLGDASQFEENLPTATGIGHAGSALAVHALATKMPGQPRENPRQTPAFQYSRCWGPRPPCFSRAVIASLPQGPRLLIGGTASVNGEDSVHIGSLNGQMNELLENLRSLLGSNNGHGRGSLQAIREVRMYHRRHEDRDELSAAIALAFPGARRLETVQADMCRPELLVEIEAVADVITGNGNPDDTGTKPRGHATS